VGGTSPRLCAKMLISFKAAFTNHKLHFTYPPMLIRAATVADVPALRVLDLASPFGARWSEAQYNGLFATPDRLKHLVLVAEIQGDVTAYLAASGVGPEWEVENIVVSTLNQRRGIARALLAELVAALRREDVQRLFLEVRESNAVARALYAALGFTEQHRRSRYYAYPEEDAIILTRAL
jgi:[ribosomal protein S18]-alanine N-acetyltransferase